MAKYTNKDIRARWWNYRWSGVYFITICTKDRVHYFGKIDDGNMILSPVGIIADLLWHEIKNHFNEVTLEEFVVMPNHIHGILILQNDQEQIQPPNDDISKNRFQNQGKNSVSSIIGSYKSAVTKHSRRLGFEMNWQVRFHDHIIRNNESYDNIRNYIINNPKKWHDDKFNSL